MSVDETSNIESYTEVVSSEEQGIYDKIVEAKKITNKNQHQGKKKKGKKKT